MYDHGDWVASGHDAPDYIVGLVRKSPLPGMHCLGNELIEIEGDVGWAESYLQAFKDFEREGKRYIRIRAGRYVDRFERRNGRWRIAERVLTDDWSRVDAVVEMQAGSEKFIRGSKDTKDTIYAIRRGRVARAVQSDLLNASRRI